MQKRSQFKTSNFSGITYLCHDCSFSALQTLVLRFWKLLGRRPNYLRESFGSAGQVESNIRFNIERHRFYLSSHGLLDLGSY